MTPRKTPAERHASMLSRLAESDRKQQVVWGIARGQTNGEVAEELGVSVRTVKQHVDDLRAAFGGIYRREVPKAWFVLTGYNPYPTDQELREETS